VQKTEEKFNSAFDKMLELTKIGDTVDSLAHKVTTDNSQDSMDSGLRQELDKTLKSVSSDVQNAQTKSHKVLESHLGRLRDKVSSAGAGLTKAETMFENSKGHILLIIFIILQIAFVASMVYLHAKKRDEKKLF